LTSEERIRHGKGKKTKRDMCERKRERE